MGNRHGCMTGIVRLALLSACLFLSGPLAFSQAQTPPITSSGLNTQVGPATTLPNGKINYDLTGGTRPGNGPNLFHSFGLFNVPTNNIANFLNETNLPTSNILSRVTGGNPSSIFGTIQTTGFGNANLFLINPAGVLFGPTASLKVGGSFHVSTADYLRLTDGVRFNALPGPQDALLSTAPVAAFGFLNPNPAPISVQGSALAVPEGQTLSLIGGDISIQGNAEFTNFGIATLDAPRGQILLASVASAGEVILGPVEQGKGLQMEGFNALGTITVAPGSLINTAGESGGTVVIRGGEFTIDGSFIFSDTLGGQNGAPLAIDAQLTGAAHIVNGSQITADIVGRGNAGDIVMAAKSLTIEGENSAVHSIDFGGAGGATANIVVHANDLVLTSGGAIYTTTSGSGNAGNITLNVGTLTTSVYDPLATSVQATIESLSFGFTTPPGLADGKAGDITITASGPIILNNTSVVSNGCFCVPGFGFGTGQGGSITLTSGPGPTSQIALNETNVSANVNDLAPGASSGTPSRITVTADTLSMTGNFPLSGGISSQTFGSAPAGNIVLNVKTLRSFPGVADGFNVAGIASLTGNGVSSPTAGPAGNIIIKGPDPNNPNDAATLIDLNGGAVATASFGRSPGASAGNITITADTVILTRMGLATSFRGEVVQTGGGIFSETEGPAPAGNIIFNVRTLLSNVTRDGTLIPAAGKDLIPTPQFIAEFDNLPPGTWVDQNVISSRSGGQFITLPKNSNPHDPMVGQPGSVTIKGPDPTNPNDAATLVALNNTLLVTTMSGGTSSTPPGQINISTDTLSLTNGTQVLADTTGAAPAGNIALKVGTLTSNIQMHGLGKPMLDPNGNLVPNNDAAPVFIKSTSEGLGQAGTITIRGTGSTDTVSTPAALVALNNTTLSTTVNNAVSSSAIPAQITITADTINLSNGTQITADTSGAAPAGDITVTATETLSLAGGSSITANTFGVGKAGDISIMTGAGANQWSSLAATDEIRLTNSTITTATFGDGNAGNVSLKTSGLRLDNASITSDAIPFEPFTGGNAGSIVVHVAGQLSLTNSVLSTSTVGNGNGGNIQLAANNLQAESSTISSATGARTGLSGGNGGTIRLAVAHETQLTRSTIDAQTTANGNAGDIVVNAAGLNLDNSSLSTSTSPNEGFFGGNAGNITVNVGQLTMNDGLIVSDSSFSAGRAGSVSVNAADSVSISGGGIFPFAIATSTQFGGDGGRIRITAPSVTMDRVGLNSATLGDGNAGDITLDVRSLSLTNGAQIAAGANFLGLGLGSGNGGKITIDASDSVLVSGSGEVTGILQPSGITSSSVGISTGDAGKITVTAPTVVVENGGIISTSTEFSGHAGSITVNGASVSLTGGGQLTSSSKVGALFGEIPTGSAGNVTVQGLASPAESVVINGAGSGISTETQGAGAGGSINISAQSFTVQNGGTLSATTSSSGNAGSITANVGAATLTNNAKISSSSTGSSASDPLQPFGNAGTVSLNVSGTFQSSNSSVTTSVQQGKGTTGTPSTITITAGQDLNLTSETTVSTLSDGLKTDAGAITLTAGNTLFLSDSHVTSKASNPDIANNPALAQDYTASGGDIKLTAPNMIHLINGEVVASVQGNVTTSGGNINIDPQFVILQNSKILANAFAGTGGNITITAGVFLADSNSKVDASSTKGINGSVDIQAPVQNLSGTLAPLPAEIVQAAQLLQARCAARLAGGTSSSFVVAGRDGLPLEPGGLLPSPLYVESERSTRLAESLGLPALHVGRSFMESNLTLVPLALGCSS